MPVPAGWRGGGDPHLGCSFSGIDGDGGLLRLRRWEEMERPPGVFACIGQDRPGHAAVTHPSNAGACDPLRFYLFVCYVDTGGQLAARRRLAPGPEPTTHCLVSGDTDGRLGRREKGTVTVCGQHGVLSEVTRVKSCPRVVSRRTLRVFPNSKEGDVCPSALFLEGRTRNIWLVPLSTPIAT